MIRRLFYIALGALLAVWTMRKLQSLHPNHVARRAAGRATGAVAALRDFAADVRGMAAEREIELRARYRLDTVDRTAKTIRGTTETPDVKDGR